MKITDRIKKAESIKAAATTIHAKAGAAIRIWSNADQVRLYTDGNGYTAILEDGSIDKIKRQGWGHIIDEACDKLSASI